MDEYSFLAMKLPLALFSLFCCTGAHSTEIQQVDFCLDYITFNSPGIDGDNEEPPMVVSWFTKNDSSSIEATDETYETIVESYHLSLTDEDGNCLPLTVACIDCYANEADIEADFTTQVMPAGLKYHIQGDIQFRVYASDRVEIAQTAPITKDESINLSNYTILLESTKDENLEDIDIDICVDDDEDVEDMAEEDPWDSEVEIEDEASDIEEEDITYTITIHRVGSGIDFRLIGGVALEGTTRDEWYLVINDEASMTFGYAGKKTFDAETTVQVYHYTEPTRYKSSFDYTIDLYNLK